MDAVQARSLKSIHIFSLGTCALCAQTIFVREMLALFTGTEFVIGALLAGWLFWVGVGGFLGGRFVSGRRPASFRLFVRLAIAVAVLLPITTLCIRFGRGLIARPPGVLPPLGVSLVCSLGLMAPFGFVYGMLYNVASELWREREGNLRGGISMVYLWEAAGSFFGALLFSFVLIEFFSQFEAAVIAAFLVILSVSLIPSERKFRNGRALALFAAAFLAGALCPSLDKRSIAFVYRGYRVEHFLTSRYGEIVAASTGEVTSVFSGGGRLFSYPEPERVQDVMNIPLLLSAEPRSVLLIGGSLGGGWEEVLKHPAVAHLDCIELDGSLFKRGIAAPTMRDAVAREGVRRQGASGRPVDIRFIVADGRFYLSSGAHRYDVIILSTPSPVNLQWNRFYTREFFEIAKNSLAPGGIFAFTHPSSENYLSEEQTRVLRSCELTLADAFRNILMLPGSTVHFVASDSGLEPDSMLSRLSARKIDAPFVGAGYLPFTLTPDRIALLRHDLERAGNLRRNTDEHPYLPLLELILEGSKAGSSITTGFKAMLAVPAFAPAAVLLALVFVAFAASRAGAKARFAVWGVGFTSLLFQLLVLLAYQSFSGLLYETIVLLTALFMAGAALGALVSIRHSAWGARRLRLNHGAFAALAVGLPAWTVLVRHATLSYPLGSLGFLACALSGGFLTGSYYPVVVRTAYREDGSSVPATFYAWDLFGACAGGLMGGLILFPFIGIGGTVLCIVLVHAMAAVFLAGRW
jgi:spermidine synthase